MCSPVVPEEDVAVVPEDADDAELVAVAVVHEDGAETGPVAGGLPLLPLRVFAASALVFFFSMERYSCGTSLDPLGAPEVGEMGLESDPERGPEALFAVTGASGGSYFSARISQEFSEIKLPRVA